jgi:hypothetical protein
VAKAFQRWQWQVEVFEGHARRFGAPLTVSAETAEEIVGLRTASESDGCRKLFDFKAPPRDLPGVSQCHAEVRNVLDVSIEEVLSRKDIAIHEFLQSVEDGIQLQVVRDSFGVKLQCAIDVFVSQNKLRHTFRLFNTTSPNEVTMHNNKLTHRAGLIRLPHVC